MATLWKENYCDNHLMDIMPLCPYLLFMHHRQLYPPDSSRFVRLSKQQEFQAREGNNIILEENRYVRLAFKCKECGMKTFLTNIYWKYFSLNWTQCRFYLIVATSVFASNKGHWMQILQFCLINCLHCRATVRWRQEIQCLLYTGFVTWTFSIYAQSVFHVQRTFVLTWQI